MLNTLDLSTISQDVCGEPLELVSGPTSKSSARGDYPPPSETEHRLTIPFSSCHHERKACRIGFQLARLTLLGYA
jgi:hypothetical protein